MRDLRRGMSLLTNWGRGTFAYLADATMQTAATSAMPRQMAAPSRRGSSIKVCASPSAGRPVKKTGAGRTPPWVLALSATVLARSAAWGIVPGPEGLQQRLAERGLGAGEKVEAEMLGQRLAVACRDLQFLEGRIGTLAR